MFSDVRSAYRFLRRHGDEVVQVIVLVKGDEADGAWKGAMRSNYGALVLSGVILLQE